MTGPTLLVIDDSLTVRKLIEIAFTDSGYEIVFAETGTAGVELAIARRPDLIILDFVLPDMHATDVCRRLAQQPSVAKTPILLMSGKDQDIIGKLASYPSVLDYIGKPFNRDQIVARVDGLLARRGAPSALAKTPSRPISTSGIDRQAAATAIYNQLRTALTQIPVWAAQVGSQPPGPYFAKRLLTRQVVDGLIGAVAPFAVAAAAPAPAGDCRVLEGDVAALPVLELLRTLSSTGRSGVLTVEHDGHRTLVALRQGAIVVASCHAPEHYLEGAAYGVHGVPGAARQAAEAVQRTSGKPIYASLFEDGHLDSHHLGSALAERTSALVGELLELEAGRFVFRDAAPLPAYAESYGRVLTLGQAQLERRRRFTPWTLVDEAIPSLDAIFERAPQFSHRLGQLDVDADERKLLTLVDGRTAVDGLLERARIARQPGLAVLFRLRDVGLIRRRAVLRTSGPVAVVRPVLVYDPDASELITPLANQLAHRHEPVPMRALDADGDWAEVALREQPSLMLLNVTGAIDRAVATAHAICAAHELAHTRLAALLDAPAPDDVDHLLRAGFDTVLLKPVHLAEIERLLGSATAPAFAAPNRA